MNASVAIAPVSEAECTRQYLEVIGSGHSLPVQGSLALVFELNRRHIDQFSFSSVGVLLQYSLPLDVPSLLKKIVVEKKGGYCFEHNRLFHAVLETLNYKVSAVLARVLYNKGVDCPQSPRTHRLIILELEGQRYVVDVGFGANGPKTPVLLSEQPTKGPYGDEYRVTQNPLGDYLLQVKKNGEFFTLYSFDLHRYNEADFEMSHFYSHRHPSAGFVNNLVVARIHEGEVRSLKNESYMKIYPDGDRSEVITSAERLREILDQEFGHKQSATDCEFLFGRFCRAV